MRFMSAVSSLALLVSMVTAHPLAKATEVIGDNPSLELSGLVVNYTIAGNTLLKFNVTNPETLANPDMASCRGSWNSTAKDWPVSANSIKCDNSQTITWFIDSWTSPRDFAIAIQDRFDDPAIGKDPYDRVTVFARAIINTTFVQYDSEDLAADPVSGSQITNTTIYAPIYAVAAK